MQDDEKTPYTTGNLILSSGLPAMGVEIHASFLKTFLDQSYYVKAPLWVNLLWLVFIWGLTIWLVSKRGPLAGLPVAGLLMIGVCGIAYGLWSAKHLWIDCASPVALCLITYTAVTAQNYLLAEWKGRKPGIFSSTFLLL